MHTGPAPSRSVITAGPLRPVASAAHWLRRGVLAVVRSQPVGTRATSFRLHHAGHGGLAVRRGRGHRRVVDAVDGSTPRVFRPTSAASWPHLAGSVALRPPDARIAPCCRSCSPASSWSPRTTSRARLVGRDRRADPRRARRPLRGRGAARARAAAGRPDARSSRCGRRRPSTSTLADPAPVRPARARGPDAPRRRRRLARARATASWRDAAYRYEVEVYVPTLDKVVTNVVTDPYSRGADDELRALGARRPDDPALQPQRLEPAATSRALAPARGLDDLRAARPRLLDRRRDACPPRTAAPTSRSPTAAATACATCATLAGAGLNTVHLLPVFDIATIEEDRADAAAARRATCRRSPPDSDAAAGVRRPRSRDTDGFNWGYDPLHYTTPEGSYATDPDGAGAHAGVPPDGRGAQRRRPAGGHGRRLQPHAAPPARTRSRSSTGSCPATTSGSTGHRRGRDLDLLREHRDRARDDGQADGRLGAHLGHAVQGRRLPVRPDGPPPQGRTCSTLRRRARRADRRPRRRRRQADLPLRRGLELRRGRRRRPLRAGHASSTWPAPASARSPTGCATPSAAAARSTTTRASRASPPGCSPTRTASPANGTPAEQRARLLHYQDLIKLGLAGNLRDYAFVDSDRRRR